MGRHSKALIGLLLAYALQSLPAWAGSLDSIRPVAPSFHRKSLGPAYNPLCASYFEPVTPSRNKLQVLLLSNVSQPGTLRAFLQVFGHQARELGHKLLEGPKLTPSAENEPQVQESVPGVIAYIKEGGPTPEELEARDKHSFLVELSDQPLNRASGERCRANLCIELTPYGQIRIHTPEGGAIPIPATNFLSATQLIWNFLGRRQSVNWYQTLHDPHLPTAPTGTDDPLFLLQFAQGAGFLTSMSGNISTRLTSGVGPHLFAITPRGVDKSKLTPTDLLVARVDTENRKVYFNNNTAHEGLKPSIDSSVAGALYEAFPEIQATLHSHSPWFLGSISTEFPYPCGAKEEAQDIICNVKRSKAHHPGESFVVKMVDHGYLLAMGPELTPAMLLQQWQEALLDLDRHWKEVNLTPEDLGPGKPVAILSRKGVVGVVQVHPDGTISPRLLPKYQRHGYGRELLQRIRELNIPVRTIDECKVLEFYVKHGFRVHSKEGRFILMVPAQITPAPR